MTSESTMDNVDGTNSRFRNSGFASNGQGHPVASAGETDKYAARSYKMDHRRRGKFILINNKKFQPTDLKERTGTDVDASNLVRVFKRLGFEVERHNDFTAMAMLNVMTKVGKEDHSDCDCFAVAVLSHGEEGILYGVDGYKIDIKNFSQPIKDCLSLAGKPKLFFIQACRGSECDDGVEVEQDADSEKRRDNLGRIPQEADFLYAFSTPPGYISWRQGWRTDNKGSYFVHALYSVLNELAFKDVELLHMLTRVNRVVAEEFESCVPDVDMTRKKQVPSIVSQLTKDLYFSKK